MATVIPAQLQPEEGGQPSSRPQNLPSLLSQGSTVSHAAGKVKPVTLCVYTMKGVGFTMSFQSGRFTTAQQITEATLNQLEVPVETGSAVFSLWLTSKHLQLQLKHYHLPCKLFKRWKELLSQYTNSCYEDVCQDEPILMLQRNAFFPLKEERKLLDPKRDNKKTLELLYHEAVSNTLNARYPLSREDLTTLAGLQAAVEVTGGITEREPSGTDINKYFPPHATSASATSVKKSISRLFKHKSVDKDTLPQDFSKAFSEASQRSSDPHQLKVLYLQFCWHKPYYGSVLFRGQIQRPFKAVHLVTYNDKQVTVAINTECLHIFENSTPPDVMLYLTYDQLSWEFEVAEEEGEDFYSSLWLEFDSFITEGDNKVTKVAKRVQVFSRQAPMMDAMISRCVADIDQREEVLRQKRLEQGNKEYLDEVCIHTYKEGEAPRTQRQERNYKEDKLSCAIYSAEGDLLESGFTLSRVLRRKNRKASAAATATTPDSVAANQPLVAGGDEGEGHRLEALNTTQASQDSKESSTDL